MPKPEFDLMHNCYTKYLKRQLYIIDIIIYVNPPLSLYIIDREKWGEVIGFLVGTPAIINN
jgi:hypothetical protein